MAEKREYLELSSDKDDNKMDIDTAFSDAGAGAPSNMESDFQIPKVEFQSGDDEVSVLKR